MIKYIFSTCLTLVIATALFSQTSIDSVLICDAKFKDPKFNNPHAGSGFLLTYKDKTYACTAKHVLFFAKTDKMQSISFGDDLKSWSFKPNPSATNGVKADRLVNEDSTENLKMPPKGDWLVFEIKGKAPDHTVIYELRKKPLNIGEVVYFLGYPYKATQPIRIRGTFEGFTKDNNLSLSVPKGTYNGCSGGPVLDEEGKVVGLVSMGYFDKQHQKMIFEPASTDYFKQIMTKHTNNHP